MIFNSYTYLLLFLPIAFIAFSLARRINLRAGFGSLVLASLVYYGIWNPNPEAPWTPLYLLLILGSCVGNFFFGRFISSHRGSSAGKAMLAAGVTLNLGVLAWFKYTGFVAGIIAHFTGATDIFPKVILALGISFFTFQQIAYLVDAWRGETEEYHFTDYLLFVSFWPQLIAGPIVHHKEMLPQFQRESWRQHPWLDRSVGLTILLIGLFKKVVIADNAAPMANALFEQASGGDAPSFLGAWLAASAYAVQIYFDFSGYSDMAIGSARLFGIRLPLNFHSPYKATSIIDFWRRWHITLSRFLRDYLYIPLGGSRCSKSRRYLNLLITMILGGFWHGAGWTYLLWGLLHGLYLCVNHAWLFLRKKSGIPAMPKPLALALTFIAVLVAWVPFRAGTYELQATGSATEALTATRTILTSMFGFNGFGAELPFYGFDLAWIVPVAILVTWLMPNTQQFMRLYQPAIDPSRFEDFQRVSRRWWHWRPNRRWFAFSLVLLLVTLFQFDKLSEFIYFQF